MISRKLILLGKAITPLLTKINPVITIALDVLCSVFPSKYDREVRRKKKARKLAKGGK